MNKIRITGICFEEFLNQLNLLYILHVFIFVIHFKFRFHHCVRCDKMNKTISHLHIF
jgi:hypothetical protein